ncbi:MAG: ABC transporter permease [Alphaproteobacteria bacterium]
MKLERRAEPSRLMGYLSPLIAAGLMLVTGFVIFTFLGQNPLAAFHAFFVAPIDDLFGLGELGLKAAPLMLIAIGLAIGFRANVWNIGAEGQLTIGAICGGGLALLFHDSQSPWLLPAVLVLGALGGMAWAAIPAFLKVRFNANEILVSLMLVYVAQLLLSYLVHGPWRSPEGYNFPETRLFSDAALLPVLVSGTRLHAGLLIGLAAVVLGWIFMARTFTGYKMHVAGLAGAAANYAGFSQKRIVWTGLLIGGAAAGLAGVGEAAGPIGQLLPSVSPGYGFSAIIVAFVGRLHAFGILLASLLMALLFIGGESAQINLGLPSAVTGVFQGLLLFFLLASDVFILFRIRFVRRARPALATSEATP